MELRSRVKKKKNTYRRCPTIRQVALRRHAGRGPLCVCLTIQPQVGSVPEVSRFGRGVGLETRPGPIHPTPGMDVASLVCALASLSVWWRHGEWAPFPGYPLARGSHRSLAAPPPPPPLPNEIGDGHQQAIWESGADCDPRPPLGIWGGGWVRPPKSQEAQFTPAALVTPPPPSRVQQTLCPTNTSV